MAVGGDGGEGAAHLQLDEETAAVEILVDRLRLHESGETKCARSVGKCARKNEGRWKEAKQTGCDERLGVKVMQGRVFVVFLQQL